MYLIIWEFEVFEAHRKEFEATYGAHGDWAQLFATDESYAGSDLLRDRVDPSRYVTIDRWRSPADFERFMADFREAYQSLDKMCERFTITEKRIGSFLDGRED